MNMTTHPCPPVNGMSQPMALLTSHATQEWYTPPWLLDVARATLGDIDVDPASCAKAQENVYARWWFGADHWDETRRDGLLIPTWGLGGGRVWLNPPYGKTGGKSNAEVWSLTLESRYVSGDVKEALLLVNSTHGYAWYERLYARYPVCTLRERVCFLNAEGKSVGPAKRGQSVFYFGPTVDAFRDAFRPHGRVILP